MAYAKQSVRKVTKTKANNTRSNTNAKPRTRKPKKTRLQ